MNKLNIPAAIRALAAGYERATGQSEAGARLLDQAKQEKRRNGIPAILFIAAAFDKLEGEKEVARLRDSLPESPFDNPYRAEQSLSATPSLLPAIPAPTGHSAPIVPAIASPKPAQTKLAECEALLAAGRIAESHEFFGKHRDQILREERERNAGLTREDLLAR